MNDYLSKSRAAAISKTSRAIVDFNKRKLKVKAKPEEYKMIEAYGQMHDTLRYRINNKQHFASSSKAPLDTVDFSLTNGFRYLADLSKEEQEEVKSRSSKL